MDRQLLNNVYLTLDWCKPRYDSSYFNKSKLSSHNSNILLCCIKYSIVNNNTVPKYDYR